MWADLTLFLTILARMTGFVAMNPILGRTGIPGIFKSGMSLLLAVTAYGMTAERPGVPETILGLAALLLLELAVGYFLGLVMNIFFYVATLGGETIDMQMGMSMGRTYDPSSQTSTTVTASLLNLLLMLLFFAANGHQTLLRIILVSGRIVPFGAAAFGQELYGAVEGRVILGEGGRSRRYYLIRQLPGDFVLYEDDIKAIVRSARASMTPLAAYMQSARAGGGL